MKKIANILEMTNRRAKRSEIWDLGVVVTCIWITLDLLGFKVIWGSFSAYSPNFNPTGDTGYYYFQRSAKEKLWQFEILINTGPFIWGSKFQNSTDTVFFLSQPKFMRKLATMVEYRLLLFLAIGKVLIFCGTLKC